MPISSAGNSPSFCGADRQVCAGRTRPARTKAGLGTGRRPGGLPHTGITLMEMVVVLAIIGVIAAVTAPSVANGLDSIRMVTASGDVSAFLNAAVNRAERRQQPVELVLSSRDNTLKLYSTEAGFSRELKLPDGVSLEMPEETEGIRRLIIMPGDNVPGIGIQIANRRGSRRIIHLDPMTGFPRVESVDTK